MSEKTLVIQVLHEGRGGNMHDDDNNVIEFRRARIPRHKKVRELRRLLQQREMLRLEKERIEAMKKQWRPKLAWGSILLVSISFGTLLTVVALSVYAALN